MEFSNQNISIYSCQFQAYVEKAKVQIKFPCNYFLQWKANNGKIIVSSQNRYQANKSEILFKQKLNINVNLLYDKINKKYLKKQSLLMINLISKSRPDQIKLVGRVSIDLSQVLNNKKFDVLTQNQLQYCSVQASMNFSIKTISVKQSTMHISQLDRSSFNEYMSFQAAIKPNQLLMHNRNEGSSTHRDFDQQRSLKGSEDRQIRSLGRDKHKMSSSSLSKQPYTPTSKPIIKNQPQQFIQNRINRSSLERSNSIPNKVQQVKHYNTQSAFHQLNNEPDSNEVNFSFQQQNSNTINQKSGKNIKRMSLSSSPIARIEQKIIPDDQSDMKILPNNLSSRNSLQLQSKSNILTNKESKIIHQDIKPIHPVNNVNGITSKQKQFFNSKVNQYQQNLLQKQLKIKKLELQLQKKSNHSQLSLSQHNQSTNKSPLFVNNIQSPNITAPLSVRNGHTRLSSQIQKSNQQSKRIINLTQALCQWQNKYSKLNLQNQQLRNQWKKQKQQLYLKITIFQTAIKIKETQIAERNRNIENLTKTISQKQRAYNEKLGQSQLLKQQVKNYKRENEGLIIQKQALLKRGAQFESKNFRLQNQIKILQQLSSQNQNQLNQTFSQRLSSYQNKINQLQSQLSEELKSKSLFKAKSESLSLNLEQQKQIKNKLKEQNAQLNANIEQVHHQIFKMSQQKQQLSQQLNKRQKQIQQLISSFKNSKNQEIVSLLEEKNKETVLLLQEKNKQLATLKENYQVESKDLEEKYTQEINQSKALYENLISLNTQKQAQSYAKIQNLQNTIINVSQQLSSYQILISQYRVKIEEQTAEIAQLKQSTQRIGNVQKQQLKEKQQLLISLGNQLEQLAKEKQKMSKQLEQINSALVQKDFEVLRLHQESQNLKSQLQIQKAKINIYDRKIHQQQTYYQQSIQNVRRQNTTQLYELQNQLQEQYNRYNQLQQIKQLIKQSLEQWQNRCSQEKISSTKMIGQLNDRIKQKEEIMNQMEHIMKGLQRDKSTIYQNMISQKQAYQQLINRYKNKQLQIRQYLQAQQCQFLKLYESFKQQKQKFAEQLIIKNQTIQQLQTHLKEQLKTIQQFTSHIESLKTSLQATSSQLISIQSRSQQQIQSINDQHNQQLEEYQQRIKELESIIQQKDGEILERQLILSQIQREKELLTKDIQTRIETIKNASIRQEQLNQIILNKQSMYNQLAHQFYIYKNNGTQNQSKIAQLQQALISSQDKFSNEIQTLKSEITSLNGQKQILNGQIQSLRSTIANLQQKTAELNLQIEQQQQKYLQLQYAHEVQLKQAILSEQQKLQQAGKNQQILRGELQTRIKQLQCSLLKANQDLDFKIKQIEIITQEKSTVQIQFQEFKQERQTLNIISYKQAIQKYKAQIKSLQKEILQLKNQANKIPSLQRTIKIKNIQLNSLKYKTSSSTTQSIDPNQVSHVQEIIQLKNQQIQALRHQNQKIKDLELQLHQIEMLNEGLYQDIQQYQEQKFHLNSQLNQKQIKLAELRQQNSNLSSTKQQMKQKNFQLFEKIKYYQTLILDFKGPQISSTQSQSQKMNNSQGSQTNQKRISNFNHNIHQSEMEVNYKLQIQTLIKKIKIYQNQIQKLKIKEEDFNKKLQQYQQVQNQLQHQIKEKEKEKLTTINSSNLTKSSSVGILSQKPKVQFRNPQQVVQTFKQIQGLIKKRNQFHNLQQCLLKLYSQKKKYETQQFQGQQSLNNQQQSKLTVNNDQKYEKAQKSNILQKIIELSNIVSVQFQNVKTKIMKSQGRNYQQKAKMIALLKPCEQGIKQIFLAVKN